MIWLLVCIGTLYIALILWLTFGFYKVDEYSIKQQHSTHKFSVVIPFRNEEKNLPSLIQSIIQIDYPKDKVEFLFVDDDSTDNSVTIIKNKLIDDVEASIDFKILKNKRRSLSPKKDAITTAITVAKNDWIITTDADCFLPKHWLTTYDSFISIYQPKMIIAPVNYAIQHSFFEYFQLLDFMSLQATTIGGFGNNLPFLANGANLCYKKEIFLKLHGFDGNDKIASGDDIFLLEKLMLQERKSIQYLKNKEAIVTTFPVKTNKDLIHQRMRWSAKSSNYTSWKIKTIGLLVFLTNLCVLLTILIPNKLNLIALVVALKVFVDSLLIFPTLSFFNHKKRWLWYILSSLVYPFYSVAIFISTLFTKYTWKDRIFKK